MAVSYDESKYRTGIDTSYYDQAVEEYKKQQEQNRATQLADAQKTQSEALKSAYLKRIQDEKNLKENLAASGIRGGATESSNLKLATNYGTDRATANTNYSNSVSEINKNIDQNIADYTSDMNSRAEEYTQNLAQAKWQAEREDAANDETQQTEYWYNYYTDYYSGVKKSKLSSALKKAKKLLAAATTDADKIKYQQMIRGIQARRGVIANK